MKNWRYILILLLIVSAGSGVSNAQTKASKKAAKLAEVKNRVESRHYTFLADYALPLRGGARQLTSEYDLRITPDSIVSFLPYFGEAYMDVPYNPTDGGIKFTSTKFDYKVGERKKGGWEITINPKDAKSIQRLVIDISSDGYASLSVTSTNKDFISFNGYLKENTKPPQPAIVDPIQ
ncbi:MAG: DUF4251 domain-containing protein [Mucilaginibacter sp.]